MYFFYGILNINMLKRAVMLSLFMLVGLGTGMYSAGRINEQIVKRIVIIVLIISGVALIKFG